MGEGKCSRIVAVLGLFLFIIVVFFFLDGLQFHRINGRDFEICPAFRARDDFALIDLIFFDVETGFTLRTVKHNCLPFHRLGLL